jgi:hypothetical protein
MKLLPLSDCISGFSTGRPSAPLGNVSMAARAATVTAIPSIPNSNS